MPVTGISARGSLSKTLKQQLENSNVGLALQDNRIDLNLYLSSAKRFAKTSIESLDIVAQSSIPDRGFEAQLAARLLIVEKELAGNGTLLSLHYKMKSFIQDYRVARKRFLMQSAFNVSFFLQNEIEKDNSLPRDKKTKLTTLLVQNLKISEKIIATDVKLKSILKDFSLQEEAIHPISDSLVKIAMQEVKKNENQIKALQNRMTIIMVVLFFVGIAVAFGVARRLNTSITQNLMHLTQAATQFRKGKLDVSVIINSKDEIGQLANTFNIMAVRIKEFVDSLESKVEQRTAQLNISNKQLISEMKGKIKAQENLKDTRSILKTALDNSQAGVLIAESTTGRVDYINDEGLQIMGESRQTIPDDFNIFTYSRKFKGYNIDGSLLKDEEYPLTHAIVKKEAIRKEYLIKKPNEEDLYLWANAAPVKNENGHIHAGVSLFLDITKIKQAEIENKNLEIQLRQAHKMEAIGTLAGGIAHDFNNLLAAIIGFAELANDDIPEWNPARHQIQEILKAGNRAKNLVKQILSFSRKSQLDRLPVVVQDVVKETVQLLRATVPTTIDIHLDIDPNSGNILADKTQISQVILNLCTNSAQSMEKDGGDLLISLQPVVIGQDDTSKYHDLDSGSHIKLTIKDTGTGIDPAIIERIFDPYFTTKEIGEGSGMGLAMVHGIVKSHKGMVFVESKPGDGSVFQIYLPKIEKTIKTKNKNKKAIFKGSEHILVVDDEAQLSKMTQLRLEKIGYKVTCKTNSQEAFDLFCSDPDRFDLIITDQTMPKLTGMQMAEKMRQIKKDMPIILSTGYSSAIDEKGVHEISVNEIIMKPVAIEELSECIRRILDGPDN